MAAVAHIPVLSVVSIAMPMNDVRYRSPRDAAQSGADAPISAIATHAGVIGMLSDRGVVIAIEPSGSDWQRISYRRPSGAEMEIVAPVELAVRLSDMIKLRSMTFPNGRIVPVAVRRYGAEDWIRLASIEQVFLTEARLGRAFGVGALALGAGALAATLGVFPAIAGVACGSGGLAGLGGSLWLRRRRAIDVRKLEQLFFAD